jgi:hypothetical protein
MIRGCRWTLALSTLLAIGAVTGAIAAPGPPVTTGSVSITGSGTVTITGQVYVQGVLTGPHPLVTIRTTTSAASCSLLKKKWIPRGRNVKISAPSGTQFGILGTAANIQVTVRGASISLTVAGTATIKFSGRGSYTPAYGVTPYRWPKTMLRLVQPATSGAHSS